MLAWFLERHTTIQTLSDGWSDPQCQLVRPSVLAGQTLSDVFVSARVAVGGGSAT